MLDPFDDTRIERMLADGRRIMREAIEEHKPVALFAGFSGGNDSIVATHFACTEYGATAIHCNTLIGIEKTREHARAVAEKWGWAFAEKKAMPSGPPATTRDGNSFDFSRLPCGRWNDGESAYEEWCFNFGMPGPGQHPKMYQRLKERLFDAFKREAKHGKDRNSRVMFVSGVRHDESSIRAGYKSAVTRRGGSVWVNPFYYQTKADFEAYRQEFGLPRNPVTDTIGVSGDCLCGTYGDRSELHGVRKVEPETADYIESLERKTEDLGLPCRWATRPTRNIRMDRLQRRLFGVEPNFQPACVGCIRRHVG